MTEKYYTMIIWFCRVCRWLEFASAANMAAQVQAMEQLIEANRQQQKQGP
jgi:hypothetical protein